MQQAKQSKPKVKITSENKCSFCKGTICCGYITSEIDKPKTKHDFDHLLWQMAHTNIQAYKDEDGWFIVANNRCQFVQDDGRCGIYETRPQVCRDYSNDYCEYDEPAEIHYKHFFPDYKSLDDFCRNKFKNWDNRFQIWAEKERRKKEKKAAKKEAKRKAKLEKKKSKEPA